MAHKEIVFDSSMRSSFSEASMGIIDLDSFDASSSQFLTRPSKPLKEFSTEGPDLNFTLEDTLDGAVSPDSTLIANPFQLPTNPFQESSILDPPIPGPFDRSLFPPQPLDTTGFSSSGFQAPGASFLEQLEGDEEELNKKNSIIPEKELVDISTYSNSSSSEEREDQPADYTVYFAGRSNDLGNLTQPFTPSSRPRFSETTIRSPPTSAPLRLLDASIQPLDATQVPITDLDSGEEQITPIAPVYGNVRTEDLLSKSNSLVRKVTSLLESKKFDADEFIKTLESEIQPRTVYKSEYPAKRESTPSTPLGYAYNSVPEMYLTPQPPTPLPAPSRHLYEHEEVTPTPLPPYPHPITLHPQTHELDITPDYLMSRLSGDSLDEGDDLAPNIHGDDFPLKHDLLTSSDDDFRNIPVPKNRIQVPMEHIPIPMDRHTKTNRSPLQHDILTTSADDIRDTSRHDHTLSSTSVPEGLDRLTDIRSGHPPFIGLDVTSRRTSRDELTPKELIVDIELSDASCLSCCIGTIVHSHLKLTNNSPCWVQTQLEFKSVKLNAEPVDLKSEHMPFSMYNRCILGTAKSEQIKVSFAPTGPPGVFTVELSVFISKIVDSCSTKPAKTFSFTAEAIKPEIAIVYPNKESKVLDFGYVREGKSYEQCVTVVNQSKCSLPLRMSLPVRSSHRQDVHFSLTPPGERSSHPVRDSSVLSTTLEGAGDGIRGRMGLWVSFTPTRTLPPSSRKSPYPPASLELNTAVEIQLDSQYVTSATKLITAIPLIANFSQADLVILESVDTLRFETQLSRSHTRSFTLHNRGNLPLTLSIQLDPPSHDLTVAPSYLNLDPTQQATATVEYRPTIPESTYTGILQILSNPGEKRQVLKVVARAEPPESPPVPQGASSPSPGTSYLLSNLLSLNWGGTQLDECVERKIVIFNTSDEDLLLDIQLASPFFFVKDNSGKYKPFLNTTISARAKIPIFLAFSPIECVLYSDNLSITDVSHNKVFQIPLVGCGGRSQIQIVNAQQTSDGYWMSIGEVKKSERNVFKVYLLNSGVRKAYIRAVCKDNQPGKPILSTPYVTITPSEFIIAPQDYKSILVTFSPRPDHIALCDNSPHCLAYIHITTGDCIAAKIYFSHLQARGSAMPTQFEYLNKLFALDISEDEDFSHFPFDCHQLSPPLETDLTVPLLGYPLSPSPSNSPTMRPRPSSVPVTHTQSQDLYLHRGSNSRGPSPQKSPDMSPVLSRKSSEALIRMSPVDKRRPSPKPVYRGVAHSPKPPTYDSFTVYPSQLNISSDARDPAKLYIRNLAQTVAKFAVGFPKQFVAVSPARGSVDPGQERQLLVSSLLMDMTDLPCSLTEYLTIHYEDSVKTVPLHIQMESTSPCTPVRESFTSVTKYLSPPNILFSPIKNNTVADLPITISNPHEFPIHWSLSSMGQTAYQHQDRGALDILKTNYAVFFFHRLSGGLASKGTSSISVTFQPRHPGTYSQSWEMQLTKGVKVIDSIKLSVSGKAEDVSLPSVRHTCTVTHGDKEDRLADNVFKPRRRRVYLEPDILNYPQIKPHATQMLKASVFNKSDDAIKFSVDELSSPFSVHKQHVQFTLDPRHCARLPVNFTPQSEGYFEEVLVVRTCAGQKLYALLKAESSFYPKK